MKMTVITMIIMGFFGLAILGAVGMLAGVIPIPQSAEESISGPVVIWGTRPAGDFEFVDTFIEANYKNISVRYIQKNIQTFEAELNEAIASGRGPDLIVISQEQLLRNRSKIQPVSVNQDTLFSFSQTYVNGAEVFLYNNSILAYPLALEPLVMFYNDRLLTSAGYAFPPRTWSELQSYSSTLTKVDDNRNIESSLVALGTFDNIEYPLDIVSTLLMQVGINIVNKNTSLDPRGVSVTRYVADASGNAAEQVFDFYTAFTNPNKKVYSWNASMPRDIDAFAQEKTSLWFGYPSDSERLRRKNPNLNFKIAEMPQVENGERRLSYGRIYGVSLLRSSKNPSAAQLVISQLLQGDPNSIFIQNSKLLQPLRTVPEKFIKTPNDTLLYRIAVQTKGYPMPTYAYTYDRFNAAVQKIVSGTASADRALRTLTQELNTYINNNGL